MGREDWPVGRELRFSKRGQQDGNSKEAGIGAAAGRSNSFMSSEERMSCRQDMLGAGVAQEKVCRRFLEEQQRRFLEEQQQGQ
eukprot:1398312-Karenia_brevis.AAC.1